jgi:glycine/D-amino acid oxidase-like deaminating enzyme
MIASLTSPRRIRPRFDRPPPSSLDRARSRSAGLASELHLARKGWEETVRELEEEAPARVASSAIARPAGWSSAPLRGGRRPPPLSLPRRSPGSNAGEE